VVLKNKIATYTKLQKLCSNIQMKYN